MLKQQHQVFVGLMVLADAFVITIATFVAWIIRRLAIEQVAINEMWPKSWEHYPKQALVFFTVPIVIIVMRQLGLYRPRRDRSLTSEITQVFKASLCAMVMLIAVLFIFRSTIFEDGYGTYRVFNTDLDAGRLQIGCLAFVLPFFLAIERITFRTALRYLRHRGWNQRHVAIVGVGRLGHVVCKTLERNSWTGLRVAYFISHNESARQITCNGKDVLGGLNDLERVLEENKPDAVYVALPSRRANMLPDVLAKLERFAVDVRIVPDVNPRYVPQSMAVSEVDGMPILSYRENPTRGVGALTKRVIDVVGALLAIIVFSPLMIVVAAVVRATSDGPAIFRQQRVSLGGEVFNIYKFRTMYHVEDEQSEATWTERGDKRITPIGRWLRKTSLDELPQFFNVLIGDMSLVGPRPERPELIERFRDDWRGYMLRQHVKAGITGWAQVNGLRGQSSLRKRLQYDLFYIKNWSLSLDLRILFLTLVRGFVHKNAH